MTACMLLSGRTNAKSTCVVVPPKAMPRESSSGPSVCRSSSGCIWMRCARCVCGSTPPGTTILPAASITRLASRKVSGAATATILPSCTAISHAPAPWGVTTWPLRISRSSIVRLLLELPEPRAARVSGHRQTFERRASRLLAADGEIEPRQPDAIVRERLHLRLLRLGQRQLRVDELEDGADTHVESALGEPVVLGGGRDGRLGRFETLCGLTDDHARLLDLLRDGESGLLDAELGRTEIGLGLAKPGDRVAAVEQRPRHGERRRPRLIQRGRRSAEEAVSGDGGEKAALHLGHHRAKRVGAKLCLAILGTLRERHGVQQSWAQRDRLEDQVVLH